MADAEIAISSNDLNDLTDALNSDELRKLVNIDRFVERDRFAATIADVLKDRTYGDVARAFEAKKIWYSKVYDYEDVASDPQVEAANIFTRAEVNGKEAVLVNHPVRYNGQTPKINRLPLNVGEDTVGILQELGIPDSRIKDLLSRGVLGSSVKQSSERLFKREGVIS